VLENQNEYHNRHHDDTVTEIEHHDEHEASSWRAEPAGKGTAGVVGGGIFAVFRATTRNPRAVEAPAQGNASGLEPPWAEFGCRERTLSERRRPPERTTLGRALYTVCPCLREEELMCAAADGAWSLAARKKRSCP